MRPKNIVLIGFMGTGKTSVGKVLAEKLGRPFVDMDRLIEEKEGRAIVDIFEQNGETFFRAIEKKVVAAVAEKEGVVVSAGGGTVLDPGNVEAIRKKGILVALTARPDTIYGRVRRSRHRPLLIQSGDVLSEIKRLYAVRAPFYEKADFSFQTDGLTSPQVAAKIIDRLLAEGVL